MIENIIVSGVRKYKCSYCGIDYLQSESAQACEALCSGNYNNVDFELINKGREHGHINGNK